MNWLQFSLGLWLLAYALFIHMCMNAPVQVEA